MCCIVNSEQLVKFCEYYAGLGLSSFPIWNARKVPAKGSSGHKDATKDPEEFLAITRLITDRYGSADMGIALRMGDELAVRNTYVVCVDVDEKNDKSGSTSLSDEGLVLPATLAASTRSGGFHYLYRTDRPLRSQGNRWPGVDIKGVGGWIAAAPTSGYEWLEEPLLSSISVAPSWLMNLEPARRRGSVDLSDVLVEREMILCPVHENEGSVPSLQVAHLEGGGTLYHCFGGCPLEAVLEAVGDPDYNMAKRLTEAWTVMARKKTDSMLNELGW